MAFFAPVVMGWLTLRIAVSYGDFDDAFRVPLLRLRRLDVE